MLINPPLKLIDPGLKVVGDVGGLTLQKPRDNFRKVKIKINPEILRRAMAGQRGAAGKAGSQSACRNQILRW